MLKKLEPQGHRRPGFWDNGFKSFSANTPIKKPGRPEGQEAAHPVVQGARRASPHHRRLPQVMAFSEVYQALQTGVVDGTENPHSNMYTQKMHEVQKHLTVTDHGYLGYAVIANKKFWDGLPADVRGNLETAMKEATTYANKIAQEENDKSPRGVKKSGKTQVYTPPRTRSWPSRRRWCRCTRRWKAASART
jgi:C4-dicarboxylate-binding protein DctP